VCSATTLLDQNYTRNAKGMITAVTSPDVGRSWVYGYDGLDRLISADNLNGTADDASPDYGATPLNRTLNCYCDARCYCFSLLP
jgi:YD repeat-containing protein